MSDQSPSADSTDATYTGRIERFHRELGIPPDYAAKRGLTLFEEAARLVVADKDPDGADVRLIQEAATQWSHMKSTAFEDGVVLLLYSGFRGVDRQASIIRNKLSNGRALDDILRLVAAPGFSEHHTGRAVDIGTAFEPPLEEGFAQTGAYFWLNQNAKAFGFRLSYPRGNPHGIAYEPWHWCWQQ